MRIAISHYYWDYPESEYGLPAALARRGNKVILSVWKGDSGKAQSYEISGFRVFLLPGINLASPMGWAKIKNPYVSGIKALYDDFCPEIVDCQSHLFFTTVESLREARRRGIPSVVTVRGVMAKRGFVVNSAQRVYLHTVASRVFKDATLVRCLTESDALEVERYGCPRGKVRVIPNFVDTEEFAPDAGGGESILWYGRFVEEKGLRHLVAAAAELLKSDGGARFVLAGHGPQREAISRMADGLGISQSLSMPGALDRQGIVSLLMSSSIVVVPSTKEGMPFSLLEAMSSGKAVLASDIPGIKDIIKDGENGLLVPPSDPDALAKGLSTLRKDQALRDRLGKAARRTILDRFSERAIVDRIEAMYREAGGQAHG
jgi:glycosyltransferase involved in cell wall biosynthesis